MLEFSFLGTPEHGTDLLSRELPSYCNKFLHQQSITMQEGTVPVSRLLYHARPPLVNLFSQLMPYCLT